MGTICISSGSGRRSIYKMAGGYLSERSGSFDYNTGSISVSVSGNRGAAFGILQNRQIVFAVGALLIFLRSSSFTGEFRRKEDLFR